MADLLTTEQVAKKLQLTRRTVERMIKDNRLKSLKIGRSRRVDSNDLDAFIEEQKRLTSAS
jgi:excisionase family DNA binding protein